MRMRAKSFRTIGVNSYHPEGAPEGNIDFVIVPEQ